MFCQNTISLKLPFSNLHIFQPTNPHLSSLVTDPKVECNVHVFAEAAGVVIAVGLGVAECLEDRVTLQQFVLDPLHLTSVLGDFCDELENLLRRFGLARAGLPCQM